MAEYAGSVELISGITPKNKGAFPLVNSKDIQVDDTGKRLDAKLREMDLELNATIPFFDLAALGLPEIPGDGTAVSLNTDTAAMKTALDCGPVKFAFGLEGGTRAEFVMNKYSIADIGLYSCFYVMSGGLFMLMIADGSLQAAVAPIETLPPVTSEDNGKVLSVVGGAWVANAVDTGTSAEIPTFDLAALGLPEIPGDGTAVSLDTDTAAMKTALDAGSVKFALNVDSGRVEIVMNKYSDDALGLYMCIYAVPNGLIMLMIADGSLQAAVMPLSTGGATIPAYDLTAMGLPTVTVGGGYVSLRTDTTQLRSDLASGSVKLTLTLAIGDYALPVSKIFNPVVIDGAVEFYGTFVTHIAGMVIHTSIDIVGDSMQACSETLDSIVTPYIDAYIGAVLGGEY